MFRLENIRFIDMATNRADEQKSPVSSGNGEAGFTFPRCRSRDSRAKSYDEGYFARSRGHLFHVKMTNETFCQGRGK
ncbi:MAG: DUF4857 domain-containing protein [Butyricimonas faecihominis]